MNYYIEKPNTWRAANRKCAEIQEFVDKFRNCLIANEVSRDALVEEIRHKVEELNEAYPRTKRLSVSFLHGDYVICQPADKNIVDEYVFTINIYPVKRTYRFAEKAADLEKGGEK